MAVERSIGAGATMASIGGRLRQRLARGATASPVDRLCEHLREAPADAVPLTERCGSCDAQGTNWPDLRLCLTCGEVGCCDSSPWQHADAHAKKTGHPVMRSFERGESWRWCYVDEMLG
jgi:uncharacterized UBP type Zn finger protein